MFQAALAPYPAVQVIRSDEACTQRGSQHRGTDPSGSVPQAIEREGAKIGQSKAKQGDSEGLDQFDGPHAATEIEQLRLKCRGNVQIVRNVDAAHDRPPKRAHMVRTGLTQFLQ